MLASSTFADLGGAWQAAVTHVLAHGDLDPGTRDRSSIGSGFTGRPRSTREVLGLAMTVRDPRSCLVDADARPIRDGWRFAQWLRMLDGRDDVDAWSPYNNRAKLFASDDGHLDGAFGYRLRVRDGDQLAAALDMLRNDPGSRRASVVFLAPGDVIRPGRDVPCALATQFLIRGGHLHAVTTMRSQSAFSLLPYDGAAFMLTQAWVASVLGCALGSHTLMFGSLHVYADEIEAANRFLLESPRVRRAAPMPAPEQSLSALLAWEHGPDPLPHPPTLPTDSLWSECATALRAARMSVPSTHELV